MDLTLGTPLFQEQSTASENTKEIVFGKDDKVSACQWAEIDNILQDEYNILFYFGKDKFYILPMESLSVEQEESINSIIQEKRINK